MYHPANRPHPSCPGPLFQNEGRCSAFDTEIVFHSHANKTHFEGEGLWNPEVSYSRESDTRKETCTAYISTQIASQNFCGVNEVHYGLCKNGECGLQTAVLRLCA